MAEIELTGLDGSNPLGFLAALGTLQIASERASQTAPRLRWMERGQWLPVVDVEWDQNQLIELVATDIESWRDSPVLSLKYPKKEDNPEKLEWDLKPPPEVFRSYLESLLGLPFPKRTDSLRYASAFSSEGAKDHNGKGKPFALHFTAGQQEFLRMLSELIGDGSAGGVTKADIEEALFGPWRYARPLPVLGWDATANRDYALRAGNPSAEKKLGVPGADWLAFRGLAFLRTTTRGKRAQTTGCQGGWKDGSFSWPLWTAWSTANTCRSVMNYPRDEFKDPKKRAARGIACLLESGIRRSDQGGYGSFTPSRVV